MCSYKRTVSELIWRHRLESEKLVAVRQIREGRHKAAHNGKLHEEFSQGDIGLSFTDCCYMVRKEPTSQTFESFL